MSKPLPDDAQYEIGPYYKIVGGILLLGAIGLNALKVIHHDPFEWEDMAITAALVLGGLALNRPKVFENAFKSLMAAIPWTKYQKPE